MRAPAVSRMYVWRSWWYEPRSIITAAGQSIWMLEYEVKDALLVATPNSLVPLISITRFIPQAIRSDRNSRKTIYQDELGTVHRSDSTKDR